jgi:thermitase
MESIYTYSYIGTLISLVIWFWRVLKERSTLLANVFFWGCLLLYIASVFFGAGGFFYKVFWVLPRDFAIFMAVALVANNLKNAKGFWAFGLVALGIFYTFFFNTLQKTFVINEGIDPSAELLMEVQDKKQLKSLQALFDKYELKVEQAFPDIKYPENTRLDQYYAVDIPEKYAYKLSDIMEDLDKESATGWIETNNMVSVDDPTADALEAQERQPNYGLNDPSLGQLWAFEKMQMGEFYGLVKNIKPKKKAKIAILDTGVDANHEDLKDNYSSTNSRYDRDVQGHGTHCAGIAAAVSNNKKGIASFAPNERFVTVTSIKVLSDQGFGSQRSIIQGILKAADEKADVISMSLGGYSNQSSQRAYEEAIAYAQKAGAIVVVAAGNESTSATKVSPANCKGVITVTALDQNLQRAKFSNEVSQIEYGVAAAGVQIFSTFPNNQYKALNGTSMATPYVAGLVGMLKALQPELNTKEVYDILKSTGLPTSNTRETGPFIQPVKALKAVL